MAITDSATDETNRPVTSEQSCGSSPRVTRRELGDAAVTDAWAFLHFYLDSIS